MGKRTSINSRNLIQHGSSPLFSNPSTEEEFDTSPTSPTPLHSGSITRLKTKISKKSFQEAEAESDTSIDLVEIYTCSPSSSAFMESPIEEKTEKRNLRPRPPARSIPPSTSSAETRNISRLNTSRGMQKQKKVEIKKMERDRSEPVQKKRKLELEIEQELFDHASRTESKSTTSTQHPNSSHLSNCNANLQNVKKQSIMKKTQPRKRYSAQAAMAKELLYLAKGLPKCLETTQRTRTRAGTTTQITRSLPPATTFTSTHLESTKMTIFNSRTLSSDSDSSKSESPDMESSGSISPTSRSAVMIGRTDRREKEIVIPKITVSQLPTNSYLEKLEISRRRIKLEEIDRKNQLREEQKLFQVREERAMRERKVSAHEPAMIKNRSKLRRRMKASNEKNSRKINLTVEMVNDSLAELKVSFQSTKSQFLKLLQPVSILRTSTSVKYSYQVYPRRNESINGSLIFQKDDEISAEISVNLGDDEDDVLSGVWNDSNWSWESDSAD